MRAWKVLGLAGLAGVAASGAIIARDTRRRQAVTPQDVRERLHARLEQAGPAGPATAADRAAPGGSARTRTGRLRRALRRGR